jgi:YD repeat-containing protein
MRAIVFLLSLLLLGASARASETITYTYDALGRLVTVARSGTVNAGSTECYKYDPASNRSNVTVSTSSDCAAGRRMGR